MFILTESEKLSFLKIVYSLMMEDSNFSEKEKNILEEVLCKEVFKLSKSTDEYQTVYPIEKLKVLIDSINSSEVHDFLFKILRDIARINTVVEDKIIDKINELKTHIKDKGI